MTPLNLQSLRKVAGAATPGEWGARIEYAQFNLYCGAGPTHFANSVQAHRDAAHIAAFNPETCLALLDRIEKLEGALKEIAGQSTPDELDDAGHDIFNIDYDEAYEKMILTARRALLAEPKGDSG